MLVSSINGLKIIAAIGFIAALAAPALIKYLEQHDASPFSWLKFSFMLLITVLIVVLIITLIIVLLTRDSGTKEERAEREQEERCNNLLSQALVVGIRQETFPAGLVLSTKGIG